MISSPDWSTRQLQNWTCTKDWANDLKLNEDKTEVLHISSKFRKTSPLSSVNIANVPIQPANSARTLGVIVTNDFSMDICISITYAALPLLLSTK